MQEGLSVFLAQQRDVSADIKRELEHSLRRLRHEAHALLDLSARLPLSQYCFIFKLVIRLRTNNTLLPIFD